MCLDIWCSPRVKQFDFWMPLIVSMENYVCKKCSRHFNTFSELLISLYTFCFFFTVCGLLIHLELAIWCIAFRRNILASFCQLTISSHYIPSVLMPDKISPQMFIRLTLCSNLILVPIRSKYVSFWLASSGWRHAGPCEWGWCYSNSGWHILDNLARWM